MSSDDRRDMIAALQRAVEHPAFQEDKAHLEKAIEILGRARWTLSDKAVLTAAVIRAFTDLFGD